MKKILFVVDERKMGGVSVVLKNIFNAFSHINFDLLVLHDNGEELSNIKNVNMIFGTKFFDVCDIRMNDILKSLNLIKILKKVYLVFLLKTGLIKNKIIKERKKILNKHYDLEICFKDGIGTYFTAYADSDYKVRWMHADYSNNDPGRKYKKSYTKALDKYDKFIAICDSIGKKFNNKYHKEDKTEVIYNIIDTEKSKIDKIIDKENYELELCSVGRLHKIKGYDRVIEAINRLNKEGLFDNKVYKIVGDGEEKNNLLALIKKYNLEDKVLLLGSDNKPWNLVQNADIFIMSSHSEAFPTTIIESLINHIPILSVEYSSVHEVLNEKNSVILNNSDESLYLGLKNVIENPKKVLELKNNVLSYNYDNNDSIEKLEKLFKE